MNKILSKIQSKAKFVWSQIKTYPKSTLLYVIIIYIGSFTECNNFIFKFSSKDYYTLLTPIILILLLLSFIRKKLAKNTFIMTSNILLALYIFLYLILGQNNLLIIYMLCLYCFYHTVYMFFFLITADNNTDNFQKQPVIIVSVWIISVAILVSFYMGLYLRCLDKAPQNPEIGSYSCGL